MKLRLNLWHRIGVVLSVLWVAVAAPRQLDGLVYTLRNDLPEREKTCEPIHLNPENDWRILNLLRKEAGQPPLLPADAAAEFQAREAARQKTCLPTVTRQHAAKVREVLLKAVGLVFGSIIAAWLGAYALLLVGRWIWAGRQISN